jgi:hypothetical protein
MTLHLLGIDHERLPFCNAGIQRCHTDLPGQVIREWIVQRKGSRDLAWRNHLAERILFLSMRFATSNLKRVK